MKTGIRSLYWINEKHGAEASLSSKVLAYNDSAKNISPFVSELLYHYRWVFVSPFGFINSRMLSVFGGVEMISNSQSSPKRMLAQALLPKVGVSVQFGLTKKIHIGGKLAYGNNGSLQSYQLAGDGTYYLNGKWAIGAGYNLKLLETQSATSSPDSSLPYREAHGDLFGYLRYLLD